jgi:hypothetical protein
MNVSVDGGRGLPAARPPLKESAPPPSRAEPMPSSGGERCWITRVEALAARWQAALGGFHTGAPPSH